MKNGCIDLVFGDMVVVVEWFKGDNNFVYVGECVMNV